jgi:Tfp pilus assembly protein PilN
MTATIAQPIGQDGQGGEPAARGGHAVDERSLRIPDIGVDLLPIEITAARRTRKIRRVVISAVGVFAVFLAVWYGLAIYETSNATDNLGRAEENVQTLTRQQRGYTELVAVQSASKTINDQLNALLAQDLQWSRLLQMLQGAAPSGVTVTGVTAALLTDEASSGSSTAKSTTVANDTVGSLTLSGVGSSKTVVAAYVDALGKVTGVANALPGDITQQEGGLQFSVHMDITKAALGGRFAKTTGTGGK